MFPDENRKRQERLSHEICHLAEKTLNTAHDEHLEVIAKLQRIYEDGFKHSYSDLFPVILKVFREDNPYDVDYLTTNLEAIRNALEIDYSNGTNQFNDIYAQFTKLCDHLNLQISQLSYFTQAGNRAEDVNTRMEAINEKLEQVTTHYEQAATELEGANKKANSLQTELIAVLSIFAAIVITFSGGITFLGSVMTSIKDVVYFESITLAAIICGMIIFNTIFLMMYMVSKITDRNIYARCLTQDCSCEYGNNRCSGLARIRKRLPYVFYVNLGAVIGIIVDLIVWFMDIKDIFI